MKSLQLISIILLVILASCTKTPEVEVIEGLWKLEEISGGLHGNGYETELGSIELKEGNTCLWFTKSENDMGFGTYSTSVNNGIEFIDFQVVYSALEEYNPHLERFCNMMKEVRIKTDTLQLVEECCDNYHYVFIR